MLKEQIERLIKQPIADEQTLNRFRERLGGGSLTRDGNDQSHFCVYFLPYNSENKKVFVVHHKKSGLWLAPGGHIDNGESLEQTLRRESIEELGYEVPEDEENEPFLLTITEIDNHPQTCREHLDIWYLLQTDGTAFNVDLREFHEMRWLTVDEAKRLATDPNNRAALETVSGM